MADRRSALADLPPPSRAEGEVVLSQVRPASLLQVSAWPSTRGAVETVLAEILGAAPPPIGSAASDPNLTVAAVAPGRYLISAAVPDLGARLQAALPSADGAVTDLAHGRVILRIEGPAAARLVGRCVALDLHPDAFPAGRVAQTSIHHVDVMLHRASSGVYHLWALRGFAASLVEWILDAGAEFGASFAPEGSRLGARA
jgi:heterotetrameric sarcosine oxidase gamma subunit